MQLWDARATLVRTMNNKAIKIVLTLIVQSITKELACTAEIYD
jgi:hypothetical protein